MAMTKEEKKVLYGIRDDIIVIMNQFTTQNNRINKTEETVNKMGEELREFDKFMSKFNLWDRIKSIALHISSGIIGALGTYVIIRNFT